MKTIGLTAALLILGLLFITPAAYADGDDGGDVFFGFTVGVPGVFYAPPPVIYAPPRARFIWPPDEDDEGYRSYHRYDHYRRYRGDDDDRGHYAHRHWAHDHWHHRHHWRDEDHDDEH